MKRILFVLLALCAFTSAQADLVLREDTASQIVPIGPFVDDTGAPLPLLTISNTDVMLSKNGATFAAKNSGACTAATGADGMYLCTFDATDSSTVGRLTVYVNESGALPVYHEFSVVEEEVYDACCAASAAPATPATIWAYSGGRTITGGTVTTNSDKTGYSLSSTQTFSNTGTWTGNLSGSVGSVTGNVSGTVNGLTSTAQGNVRTAVGLASANLDTQLSTIDSVADAIKLKTDNLTFTVTGQVDANVESMNATEVLGTGTSADPWNGE